MFETQILRSVTVSASNSNSCVMVTKIIISGSRIVSEGRQQAVLSGDNGDDEWDMTDLKLCSEITTKGPLDAEAKKREIVKFAKDRFHDAF